MPSFLRNEVRQHQLRSMQAIGFSDADLRLRHQVEIEGVRKNLAPEARRHLDAVIANADLPSDLQSPLHHANLVWWFARVKRALHCAAHERPLDPILASAYGDDINGYALSDGDGHYAIIFGETFFDLCRHLPILLLPGIGPGPRKPIFERDKAVIVARMQEDGLLQQCFDQLLCAHLCEGSVSRSLGILVPQGPDVAALADEIAHGIGLFAMGHEYGHILDGHFDPAGPGRVLSSNDLARTDLPSGLLNFQARHLIEYRADFLGMHACIRADEDIEVVRLYQYGVLAYLYFQYLLEHALMLWVRGKELYENDYSTVFDTFTVAVTSHPCASLRAKIRVQELPAELEHSGRMLGLADTIESIDFTVRTVFEEYWRRFRARVTPEAILANPLSPRWSGSSRLRAARTPVRGEYSSVDEMADLLAAELAAHGSSYPID